MLDVHGQAVAGATFPVPMWHLYMAAAEKKPPGAAVPDTELLPRVHAVHARLLGLPRRPAGGRPPRRRQRSRPRRTRRQSRTSRRPRSSRGSAESTSQFSLRLRWAPWKNCSRSARRSSSCSAACSRSTPRTWRWTRPPDAFWPSRPPQRSICRRFPRRRWTGSRSVLPTCRRRCRSSRASLPGRPVSQELAAGEAMGISTGGVVPDGADSVVPIEDVEERDGVLVVPGEVVEGANVRPRGGDLRAGDPVVGAGVRLGPVHLGALAAAGVTTVRASRSPRVVLAVTGTELALDRRGARARRDLRRERRDPGHPDPQHRSERSSACRR